MSLSDGTQCGISYIGYGICVGGKGCLDSFEVAKRGITHIVALGKESIADTIPSGKGGRRIMYYNIDIEDEENAPWMEVFNDPSLRPFIELALPPPSSTESFSNPEHSEHRLLVLSSNGLSGGVFLAHGILMLYKQHTLLQASMRVFLGRPCSSTFRSALEALHVLSGSRSSFESTDIRRLGSERAMEEKLLEDLWVPCSRERCQCLALNKKFMPVEEKLRPIADFSGCAEDTVPELGSDFTFACGSIGCAYPMF